MHYGDGCSWMAVLFRNEDYGVGSRVSYSPAFLGRLKKEQGLFIWLTGYNLGARIGALEWWTIVKYTIWNIVSSKSLVNSSRQ